jgi:hypothetical protein
MRRTVAQPSSWSSMIRQVWKGDDHINPKKLLERQYLYRSLLALRLRELMMIKAAAAGAGGGTSPLRRRDDDDADEEAVAATTANDNSSFEELYETATADLEGRHLERLPNVDLRRTVQELLRPQVQAIFQSLRTVDETLQIRNDDDDDDDKKHNDDEDGTTTIWQRDDSYYRDILLQEHDTVQRQMSAGKRTTKNPHRRYFFDTKSLALETILQYHGWKECGSNPLLVPNTTTMDAFGMDLSHHTASSIGLIRQHQTLNLCRSALLRHELGYSVIALRSSIAGRGLFLDGCAAWPGTILAFFPGDVWPKEHLLTNAPDVMDHFENDDDSHISLRFDDYVMDARQSPVTVLSQPASCNPYALAHMANHAGHASMINCQSTMLDFVTTTGHQPSSALDESLLLRYIPNTYARPPTWQSRFFFGFGQDILMHGLTLLSLRASVSNQELFYDYRLQSDEPPDWYQAIPDDSLPQVVFFRKDWQQHD